MFIVCSLFVSYISHQLRIFMIVFFLIALRKFIYIDVLEMEKKKKGVEKFMNINCFEIKSHLFIYCDCTIGNSTEGLYGQRGN